MITLAPFETADFDNLIRWIDSEDLLMKWSGSLFSFPLTNVSLEWYIKDTNIADKSDAFIYKVEAEDGTSIGHISLGGISWKNRSARITRVLISPEYRGKGCCSEMITAVLKIGFETLNLHRIGLGVYTNNDAAVSCYQKSGLKIEGIQRDILWQRDHFWSMIEMSILEDEWKEMNLVS